MASLSFSLDTIISDYDDEETQEFVRYRLLLAAIKYARKSSFQNDLTGRSHPWVGPCIE